MILIYYRGIKGWIRNAAPVVARRLHLTKFYPLEMSKGVVELAMIVISHILFCIGMVQLFSINFLKIGLFKIHLTHFVYGFLLGIGEVSFAMMLSQIAVAIVQQFFSKSAPKNVDTWLSISRGGWVRHYFQAFEILPFWFAGFIIMLQIASEEFFFRGILFNYYLPYGASLSISITTTFFVLMQLFFMPNIFAAMFPVIGALVIGIFHGMLYSQVPELIPLITAHFVFFLFALLRK